MFLASPDPMLRNSMVHALVTSSIRGTCLVDDSRSANSRATPYGVLPFLVAHSSAIPLRVRRMGMAGVRGRCGGAGCGVARALRLGEASAAITVRERRDEDQLMAIFGSTPEAGRALHKSGASP